MNASRLILGAAAAVAALAGPVPAALAADVTNPAKHPSPVTITIDGQTYKDGEDTLPGYDDQQCTPIPGVEYDFAANQILYYDQGELVKTATWTEWDRISSYATWKKQQQGGNSTPTTTTPATPSGSGSAGAGASNPGAASPGTTTSAPSSAAAPAASGPATAGSPTTTATAPKRTKPTAKAPASTGAKQQRSGSKRSADRSAAAAGTAGAVAGAAGGGGRKGDGGTPSSAKAAAAKDAKGAAPADGAAAPAAGAETATAAAAVASDEGTPVVAATPAKATTPLADRGTTSTRAAGIVILLTLVAGGVSLLSGGFIRRHVTGRRGTQGAYA